MNVMFGLSSDGLSRTAMQACAVRESKLSNAAVVLSLIACHNGISMDFNTRVRSMTPQKQ
jgi:hypothetical protein